MSKQVDSFDALKESVRQVVENRRRSDEELTAVTRQMEQFMNELQMTKAEVRSLVTKTSAITDNAITNDKIQINTADLKGFFWRWVFPTILIILAIYVATLFMPRPTPAANAAEPQAVVGACVPVEYDWIGEIEWRREIAALFFREEPEEFREDTVDDPPVGLVDLEEAAMVICEAPPAQEVAPPAPAVTPQVIELQPRRGLFNRRL